MAQPVMSQFPSIFSAGIKDVKPNPLSQFEVKSDIPMLATKVQKYVYTVPPCPANSFAYKPPGSFARCYKNPSDINISNTKGAMMAEAMLRGIPATGSAAQIQQRMALATAAPGVYIPGYTKTAPKRRRRRRADNGAPARSGRRYSTKCSSGQCSYTLVELQKKASRNNISYSGKTKAQVYNALRRRNVV